jgi:hypothetical protein
MPTVSNAPDEGWAQRFDLMRRRAEFADVFATAAIRPEVEAVAALARRGVVDLSWCRDLFAERADELVVRVRGLDRDGLRDAYSLLFLKERLVAGAVRELLGALSDSPLPLFVADAIGEVVGAVTSAEPLARAWAWFMTGEAESDS